jgi:SAM-dependent methyltransferase
MTTFDYDAELRRYQEHLRAAIAVSPTDHVLDVGCGAGQTTREAAAVAASAVGVDVSAAMLERARRLSGGLANISFVQADAQTHPFPAGRYDLAVSRFGTMFFADPVAAFANIGRALRPGARLVQLVWQGGEHQEWSAAIHDSLAGATPPLAAPAFSLADPAVVEDVLTRAGFTGVALTDLREPVYYGADADAALDAARALRMTQDLLAAAADPDAALDRLRAVLADHQTPEGVAFDSRAWLVTASRQATA